ncbi:hypothetical protein F4777DRAFT_405996 [Nemania sp. FL0916]|nr:hypothetical protein F4777DRAFT_405996 [Nemania sp. FL0916]
MSIRPLPDNVIAQIKSSATITSLNGAVCGLIQNSLDAGATKVAVCVDYIRGNCSVEDDGLGIPPAEFSAGGGLGKLHFTSKYPAREDEDIHGKYGTFLASLASLSLLSITSHHHLYHTHNSLQIHNSDILARHTPSPPGERLLSSAHGTRVTVRDLFGSMPVRVKQRAIDVDRGVHSKHWDFLRREIVALLLAWKGSVSLSAREAANNWTFSIRGRQMHQNSQEFEVDLTAKVSRIMYQAQLCDDIKPETWIPLSASAGALSVTGAVSLHPIATRRLQFISIGIHPVFNEHGSNVLYEEINRLFSSSTYGAEEDVDILSEDQHDRKAEDRFHTRNGLTNQHFRSRKGIDRWPMFYIKIHIRGSTGSMAFTDMDELLDERHQSLASIVSILKAVAYEFLKKYHFRPKRFRSTRQDSTNKALRTDPKTVGKHSSKPTSETQPRDKQLIGDLATTRLSIRQGKSPHSRPESPFDHWSRVKHGTIQQALSEKIVDIKSTGAESQAPGLSDRRISPPTSHSDTPPLFGPDGNLLRAPFATANSSVNDSLQIHLPETMEKGRLDNDITWTNPATKEISIIDPRTGFIIQPQNRSTGGQRETSGSERRNRVQLHHTSIPAEQQSVWLKELLSSWENPVFQITQPRIPCASGDGDGLGWQTQHTKWGNWFQESPEGGPPIQGRVSKAALRDAEIIAQVDRKFIFVKVAADSPANGPIVPSLKASLLLMIDQHAADERCRVESLMEAYFQPTGVVASSDGPSSGAEAAPVVFMACSELLEQPLKFDVSMKDGAQLESTVKNFAYWGICYHVVPASTTGKTSHRLVEVTKLPPSIIERCRFEPRLLIELLRKETWKFGAHNETIHSKGSGTRAPEDTTPHWITRLHGCPEGIIEMINSRACRSSIMFNDPLSQEECSDLLKRLADCAFPFQCAHGRPSMVPLLDLGADMTNTYHEKKPAASFSKAFKAWTAEG